MSAYSKNLFSILSEDGDVRPEPVAAPKEEKKVDEKPKSADKRSSKPKANGRGKDNGRPTRGRQFDRHSGTGIVDSEKKIKRGWGKPETAEAEAANDKLNPADPDAPEADAPVSEPEEQVKTLEEYLAEKANKSLNVSLPEARKANDDADDAFKGAVAFKREEEEEYFANKNAKSSKKNADKPRKEKVFVDIEQRFEDKSNDFRGRRGNDRRGGRGNGRRGGNNNGRRGGNNRQQSKTPAVNLEDASAFPSLSA
ncbi:hypothetical protein BDF20DRAFT_897070 [Mycotypha africana]|uniref:uncharacterized protein n=1 Tax=Mycotypha africana TaxID=64632 RepID=UPI0023015A65|nr:uncharacterized protein BDF20DRAFT_897070 [Mycotypha africana]KAI8968567.1 hypothetical protein BDF20DRAFT_897070 [Mycotypha africana]